MSSLAAIPAERREAAYVALKSAFGPRPVGALALLKGGVSGALIFRVEVGERPYVLRLEPERIALEHRQRGFACMSAAGAAGAAPPVRFADPASGIAVMDFVESRPLSEHPGGPAGLVRALGELIARVQTTPPFPSLADGRDVIESVLIGLAGSGVLAPGLLDRHVECLARIRAAYRWDPSQLVSSHNDPNPRNMLFDGRRLWLVDWELASRNDPFFDLAILTTELAATDDLEAVLFTAAFGRAPDHIDRARLNVVRQLTWLFYGCIALEAFASEPRSAPDRSLAALTPAGFRAAVAEGRLGADQTAYAFGKMSLAAFIDGVSAPGFEEALSLVRQAPRQVVPRD